MATSCPYPSAISSFVTDAGGNRWTTSAPRAVIAAETGSTARGASKLLCACTSLAAKVTAVTDWIVPPRTTISASRTWSRLGFVTVTANCFPLRDAEPLSPGNDAGAVFLV